jgi:hypothetical protein
MSESKRLPQVSWRVAAPIMLGAGAIALATWYRRPIATWKADEASMAGQSHIRTYLPHAEFPGEVTVTIQASPQTVYAAIQRVRLADMPIAGWLGKMRYLPGRFLSFFDPDRDAFEEEPSTLNEPTVASTMEMPFIDLVLTEGGNIVLLDLPGRELVIGAIGKFHNPTDQQIVKLHTPAEFVEFDDPEYQKLAMSFRIVPLEDGERCRLEFVHGTHALSPAAGRKFVLYWLAIKPGGNFVSWLMLRAIKRIAEQAQEQATQQVELLESEF